MKNTQPFFKSLSHIGVIRAENCWLAALKFGKIQAHMSGKKLVSILQSKPGCYKVGYSDGSIGKLHISEVN